MSGVVTFILGVHNWWNGVAKEKALVTKRPGALRIGVLGAAAINPVALFDPAGSHADVVVAGVAARSRERAAAQIAQWQLAPTAAPAEGGDGAAGGGCRAYGSYAELLADPGIDAVYIALPNGLHAEWARRALEAGKHVLVEKPVTSNAAEAAGVRDAAGRAGRVALEAFHWRFHPAAHLVKQLAEGGEFGPVTAVHATMHLPAGTLAADDIRFDYALGGGACMDLTYVFSGATYFASPDMAGSTYAVTDATPRRSPADGRIDEAMRAAFTVEYPGRPAVRCTVDADLAQPDRLFGLIPKRWNFNQFVTIECQRARIDFPNFPGPWLGHTITVTEKDAQGNLTGKVHKHKAYVDGPQWGSRGKPWWTTYRYQLEAFVDRIRAVEKKQANPDGDDDPKEQQPWVSLDDSVKLMELIDAVYEEAGLPKRGAGE